MGRIKLTLAQAESLSRQEVENYLKKNPNFKSLKDEFEGRFSCTYLINDTFVFIFNEPDGYIKAYLSEPNLTARIFARKSEIVLNNNIFSTF